MYYLWNNIGKFENSFSLDRIELRSFLLDLFIIKNHRKFTIQSCGNICLAKKKKSLSY